MCIVFSDQPQAAVCTECPAGYYCLTNSTTYTTQICPAGYYCPNGTRHAYEFPCSKGSYNPVQMATGVEDCLSCPPGQYCDSKYMYCS